MRGKKPIPFFIRARNILRNATFVPSTGCIERKTCLLKTGYSVVKVTPDGKKRMGTHRFIWTALKGEIPHGTDVLHKCDNPKCINIDHLELGNDKKNMIDMCSRGRGKNRFGRHKLNVDLVKWIRSENALNKRSPKYYADTLNVSVRTVRSVLSNASWNWF